MFENSEALLQNLVRGDEICRIEAAAGLARLEDSSEQIVRMLESAVVCDPSQTVQAMALTALAAPVHQQLYRQLGSAIITDEKSQKAFLHHLDQWVADGLIAPSVAATITEHEMSAPPNSDGATPLPAKPPMTLYDGEIALESLAPEVIEPPLLEKQKFSLIGALTSEITIKIVLYLGAFLIVAAAVIYAGLYESARFPMLTVTLLGFLAAARITHQRLPLGSFVLFVIGTLLIPIDATVYFIVNDIETSILDWAGIAAIMSVIWTLGTYVYHSRFLSLMFFTTFSIAVYLVAATHISIESDGFLLVVSLVGLAGLGEATLLHRWQANNLYAPIFMTAQLQALGILGYVTTNLFNKMDTLLARIADEGKLFAFNSQEAALLGMWLTLSVFYVASDHLIGHMKKWGLPAFRFLAVCCLMPVPIFIMEALSANSHQITAVLWLWGVGVVITTEVLEWMPGYWRRTYAFLLFGFASLFLLAAPLVEYATSLDHAARYFLASGLVYLMLSYRRMNALLWSVALITAYLAYLIEVKIVSEAAAAVFPGFALLLPALFFFAVDLAGRRYFRATLSWTGTPFLLGFINTLWDLGILFSWYNEYPHHAALIFLIYGIFGMVYAGVSARIEREYTATAWRAGLIAFYGAYINAIPNVKELEFGGYALLVPALIYLTGALVSQRYFRAVTYWTRPLLVLGLFNLGLGVLAAFAGGLDGYPGSAALVFLIYGIFGAGYAVLSMQSERVSAILIWTAGLIALYTAYGFLYRQHTFNHPDIFLGYVLLLPALVFLSADLGARLYFRLSQEWTLPLFSFGMLNALLAMLVTFYGGLTDTADSAALALLVFGVFGILYALLSMRSAHRYTFPAWVSGLIALYVAYLFMYRGMDHEEIFIGYVWLLPALIFFSAELVGRVYLRVSRAWTFPLLGLGLLNAGLVVPFTLDGGFKDSVSSAALILSVYGLFGVVYALVSRRSDYGIPAWTIGLIALYAAYGFIYRWQIPDHPSLFPGYVWLLPALVFLSADLIGQFYLRVRRGWTQPLFFLGLLNAGLVIPLTLRGGFEAAPGSATLTFLVYGVFGVFYALFSTRSASHYAIPAWIAGLIALYAAYGFYFRLERPALFPGYIWLLPAIVFLSAELAGQLYYRVSRDWTLPLFALGILNGGLVIPLTFRGGFENTAGSAALSALIFGLFCIFYTRLTLPSVRKYAITAWAVGLIALDTAYIFAYRALNPADIFRAYIWLLPAMVFLSAELAGQLYFRASLTWTFPLFVLGLLNVIVVFPVGIAWGLSEMPGSALITFLVTGLFGVVYARLLAPVSYRNAIAAWILSLIALYTAYLFVNQLSTVAQYDIFPGYVLLLPAIVFLSAELVGQLYFRVSEDWTQPLFALGLLNVMAVAPVALGRGIQGDMPGEAVITFFAGGLFGVIYARLLVFAKYKDGIAAWILSLIALYTAYLFIYQLPGVQQYDIFPAYVWLIPALAFLSAELAGRVYFRVSQGWTVPLFVLGMLNAILVIPVTVDNGLEETSGSAALTFLIYGLFGLLYARLSVQFRHSYAIAAWAVGWIALYAAYLFLYRLPAPVKWDIFVGYALLLPALVFLGADLFGRHYFHAKRAWTLPLLGLGLLNAVLVIPVTLEGGFEEAPGSAAIIFLLYGVISVLNTLSRMRVERPVAIFAWIIGLGVFHIAYGFAYRFLALDHPHIFPGYVLMLPALVCLSAELAGKFYFRVSREWTQPLLALGLLNTGLIIPLMLGSGLTPAVGSAALMCLFFGLFGGLYGLLHGSKELGYVATACLTLALAFTLRFYDQAHWVIPFTFLALVYSLAGLVVNYQYHQPDWAKVLHWSGLILGTVTALTAPLQGGGSAAIGMAVIATLYGVEGFLRSNVWFGLPANGLLLSAYFTALLAGGVTEPQFYSMGTGLLAIVTHYLLNRRTEGNAKFVIGFATGVVAQVILLGTSFYQMDARLPDGDGVLQFFFVLFFQSLILLAYGLVIRSLSFIIIPILFVVGAVLDVVFSKLASYSTVVTLGCTGTALLVVGITALLMRERLLKAYGEFHYIAK